MMGLTSVAKDLVPSQVGVVIVPPPALDLLQPYKTAPINNNRKILFMVFFL
jgi:hypothetical protein